MTFQPNPKRHDAMLCRSRGKSGVKWVAVSLGLWHNFGAATPMAKQRAMPCTAFDLGVPHFDLANNCGVLAGSAESNFDAHLRALDEMALARGQSLAQMATAWVLHDERAASALIGASRPGQVAELVAALQSRQFSKEALAAIDQHAAQSGIKLWQGRASEPRSTSMRPCKILGTHRCDANRD